MYNISMYKNINIARVGQFKQSVDKAFISDKGIVTVVTLKRKIAIFHEDNPTDMIYLDRQLEIKFFAKFKKLKEIREIHNEDKKSSQTILLFFMDSSLCIISIETISIDEQSQPKISIQRIKLVDILDDTQIPLNNDNFIDLIDLRRQTALFTLWNRVSKKIMVLSYQIKAQTHSIDTQLTFSCQLVYDVNNQDQGFMADSLLSNRFKVKWFDHYLIFFDQIVSSQNLNRLYMADLTNCVEGNQFKIQNIYQLPEITDYSFLKDIQITPLNRQINQNAISLFFQHTTYLQIIEITIKDSKTPLKTIKHPFISLLNIVSSSITGQQLQKKGQNYSRETLTYLIHFMNGLDQTNKLAIIGSPTAHKSITIVNEIKLPQTISHFVENSKNKYIVCQNEILKIILTPKAQIYRQMLAELNAKVLGQMIEQFLE